MLGQSFCNTFWVLLRTFAFFENAIYSIIFHLFRNLHFIQPQGWPSLVAIVDTRDRLNKHHLLRNRTRGCVRHDTCIVHTASVAQPHFYNNMRRGLKWPTRWTLFTPIQAYVLIFIEIVLSYSYLYQFSALGVTDFEVILSLQLVSSIVLQTSVCSSTSKY